MKLRAARLRFPDLIACQVRINMVITDFSMPGMDGMELLKIIREKSQSLPVILMTAYGGKAISIEALKNRFDGFIDKPFTLGALIMEIERIQYLKPGHSDPA